MTNKEYLYEWIRLQNKCLNNPFIQRARPDKGNFILEDYITDNELHFKLSFKQGDITVPIFKKFYNVQLAEVDEFYGQVVQEITTWSMFGKDNQNMRSDGLKTFNHYSFNTLAQKGLIYDNNS